MWDSDPKAVQTNQSVDVEYVDKLLNFLEGEHCVNTSLIFATGLGTGGGMSHLLACNSTLSRRIAAFAAISGAFYDSDSKESIWHTCDIGRRPIPFLEIHGNDDERWSYWPPKVPGASENGLEALGPSKWLKAWAVRNNCGAKVGDPYTSSTSAATILTPLTHGKLSEGVEYGGGAVRVAYSCPPSSVQNIAGDDDIRSLWNLDLLHYSLKGEQYGWPRKDLRQEKEIMVNGVKVQPPGEANFDATKVMFEWFVSHPMPPEDIVKKQVDEMAKEEKEKAKSRKEKDEL
jgi:hypothetical protein